MKTLWTVWFSLALLLIGGCLPTAKEQSCSTGSVFNPTSRNCVPITSGGNTSGISIATRSPQTSVIPVGKTETNQYDFAVTVNNPLNESYAITWKFYPPSGVPFTGNPVVLNAPTYSFIPAFITALEPGTWTLAAEVFNGNGTLLLQSATWQIVVNGGGQPNISINTPSSDLDTTTGNRITTDRTPLQLAVNVNNPAGSVPTRLYWFYDGVQQGSFTSHAGPAGDVRKTFFTSNVDTPAGVHTIRAELRNSAGTTVLNSLEWTIYVTPPNLPQIASGANAPLPDPNITVSAIHTVALNLGGFTSSAPPAGNIFPARAFCVSVTDHLGSLGALGGVTVQFSDRYATIGTIQSFSAALAPICLGDTVPTYAARLTNPTVGEFQTLTAEVKDVGTGTTIGRVNWNLSIRPQNTPPTAILGSPVSPTVVQQGGNPAATNFVMDVNDVDTTNPLDMSVYFFFDGVAMNGVNKFPGTSITTPNCTRLAGSGVATAPARYTCPVVLPAFGVTGRRPATGTYTITSYVVDTATYGGAAQSSGTITWQVNPMLGQTLPRVAPQGTVNSTPAYCDLALPATCDLTTTLPAGDSFIALQTSPLNPITTTQPEGTNVVFNILVEDYERDNFFLTIERCATASCAVRTPVATDVPINRNSDTLGYRANYTYRIPQDVVVGAANGNVTFRASVQERLPDGSVSPIPPVALPFTDLTINVNNFNPFPVWAGAASSRPLPTDVLSVVTGVPLTFDPGPITDASTIDGNIINYQWEISRDSGATWQQITGATQRILKWTPSNNVDGQTLRIRLCLGDDGFGNELTNCVGTASPSNPAAVVGPWNTVNARKNFVAKAANGFNNVSDGAAWLDVNGRAQYMAYVNNNGTDNSTIVIEKHTIGTNGAMTLAGTVSFASEFSGTAYDASRLSLIGQSKTIAGREYKNLYVAYVTQSVSQAVSPRMRVRQIDITNNAFLFNYLNVIEADETVDNITVARTAPGTLTIAVGNAQFTSGEQIIINGVTLTAVPGAPGNCQFQYAAANTPADQQAVASSLYTQYNACAATPLDERKFVPSPSPVAAAVTAGVWTINNFPQQWIDVANSLYAGRAADMILQNDYLLLPYLDNVNAGRISVTTINTLADFDSGSLGTAVTAPYTVPTTNILVGTTAQGQDIAVSHNGSASFDVAITTATSDVNVYRMAFATTPAVTVSSAAVNIFAGTVAVRRPRVASGNALTNNNVYVVAEDLSDLNHQLHYARINASTYTLATNSPVTPLSSDHEQTYSLAQYRIQALAADKNVALAVVTQSQKVLVSVLRPELPGLDFPEIFPRDTALATDGAGFTYPAVAAAATAPTVPPAILAMSRAQTFLVGDAGAVASENSKETVLLFHPVATGTGFAQSLVNLATENISATSATSASQGLGFQPAYIK